MSDIGSTESATINTFNCSQIAGPVPPFNHNINELRGIHIHQLFGSNNTLAPDNTYAIKSDAEADIKIHENSAFYFGEKNTDNTWRI